MENLFSEVDLKHIYLWASIALQLWLVIHFNHQKSICWVTGDGYFVFPAKLLLYSLLICYYLIENHFSFPLSSLHTTILKNEYHRYLPIHMISNMQWFSNLLAVMLSEPLFLWTRCLSISVFDNDDDDNKWKDIPLSPSISFSLITSWLSFCCASGFKFLITFAKMGSGSCLWVLWIRLSFISWSSFPCRWQ